ncbi:acyltransferase family protein [Bradyrhizobium sp. STM 3809]|uniref:acyltransferase family protein n=1 Tax=Bradyrhizobium sp. STM 3809 TaxID=551936 RepID=UPI0011121873|nr:acyltransferase family protein [Bradyrhizobium sp. STM 3809]
MRYRADIDGLRALAVLAVLVYHAFPAALPGGFFGVDVFFVISGYLITSLIRLQISQQRFNIADFYARRIRRIFPALVLVIATTFTLGWFLLPLHEMQSLGTNIAASVVFLQNFVLLGQVGYFDIAAEKKPLLHLWSLGIEEQYYVVWPLVLLLVRRWKMNGLIVATVFGAASFVLCLIVGTRAPDYAFYLPFTRAWELLAGSALAVWHGDRTPGLPEADSRLRRASDLAAWCGFIGILISFGIYQPGFSHPGWFTLLPVVGAAVLIAGRGSLIHRLLVTPPMVFLGLISYPLYLWHFPLMAYARIHFVDSVPVGYMLAILLVSGLLAWLTYAAVERPLRFGNRNVRLKVGGLATAMIALALVGVAADLTHGLPIRIPAKIRPFMLTNEDSLAAMRSGKCLLLPDQGPEQFAPECTGNGDRPLVVIWGDSYAAALSPGLRHFAPARNFDLAQFTASACPPLIDYVNPERPFCKSINDDVLRRLSTLQPDVVIFHSTWSYHRQVDDFRRDLRRSVALVKPLTKKIVVIGPVASWLGDGLPANILDYYYQSGNFALLPERTWFRSNENWTSAAEAMVESEATALGLDYISAHRLLCNEAGCLTRIGPELVTFDNGHFTPAGSTYLVGKSIDRILEAKP